MSKKTTDTINLLLQLGKIGTRVQILRESGELVPDQLFFKSLQDRKISWSDHRKSITMSPYVLILPGKMTGLLSIAPSVQHIPDSLCLGIVSKNTVLELIFQNSRDRGIWSKGLSLLVSSPCLTIVPSPTKRRNSISEYYLNDTKYTENNAWNGNDIFQWHEITGVERQNIKDFYDFLGVLSCKGSLFTQYKKLTVPKKILITLDTNGEILYGIDGETNDIVWKMLFDSETVIIERETNNEQKKGENGRHYFPHASSSMHCFSILRKEQTLHIGCGDKEQYQTWKNGLEYLSDAHNYLIRHKIRRAILAGDLRLSQGKKHLLHQKQDSNGKNTGFWGTLFN